MPGFNQQGPMNQGPMTGRGRGVCVNGPAAATTGFGAPRSQGYGLGCRRGRGMGQGWGQGYGRQAPMAVQAETTMESLRLRAEALESELIAIKESLANLSNQ